MARAGFCYREVLPFAAMFVVECTNVGLSTIFKAATLNGLNYKVFMVYSYAISTIALMPLAFIFHRKSQIPPFSISLLFRIIILAIFGFTAQMLGYKGIVYSSPTLASALSNVQPACTFVLAIIFRMEKLALRRLSSQAKIIGTVVSIAGAFVVVLYKGPEVIKIESPSIPLHDPSTSSQSNWILGGGLLAADYVLVSIWYILQAQVVKDFPAKLLLVFFYSMTLTIIATPVCFIMEHDLSAWRIKVDISLVAILYSGIIGTAFGISVHTWGLHVKGAMYVALFRPLSIAIAAIMGVIFLGNAFSLGCVVGAILISIGFYMVLWGKTQENMGEDLGTVSNQDEPMATEHVPMLQGYISPTPEEKT